MHSSSRAHKLLNQRIRRDDDRYFQALVKSHGMEIVDVSSYRSQWETAAKKTRDRMAGRIYPRKLLKRVMSAAGVQ